MKKYQIEAISITPRMIKGEEPWNTVSDVICGCEEIEADSAEEAIDLAKSYLKYECDEHAEPYQDDDDILIWHDEDGQIMSGLAFFKAVLIEKE